MLSREENELVTRIGPGTPMGEVLRRYWLPALLSTELPEPDGEPVRVKLLGEDLLAFRDTDGRIGLVDEACPHRLASLWFGRNEERGIRCVYHGWKFDVDGNCVEQMNEPVPFCEKVKLKAYPTTEFGGVIWTYMGPAEKRPPEPKFEWTQVPPEHRHVNKVIQECNWLQTLEGGIDSSHAPILHRRLRENASHPGTSPNAPFVRASAPVLEVDPTEYGYRYVGIRQMPEGGQYVRAYHYVMPFTQLRPSQFGREGRVDKPRQYGPGHMWVPMDDENTMVWNFMYTYGDEPGLTDEERSMYVEGNGPTHVDQKTWRSYANRANDWKIDRQVQRYETFTGIEGINTQDRAIQETMGRVVDRSREYLGPADRAIITTRRMLLEAIKTVQAGGDPPGTNDSYYTARAIERILPEEQPWRDAMLPLMYPAEEREVAGVR